MWISDPHQNLHSCVSHIVDWGPYLLWKSPSLIFISDFFCNFSAEKNSRRNRNKKSEQKSEQKSEHQAEDLLHGSVNASPCVLAFGLWFSDQSQRNEELLETYVCCASLFCIAPARLDHIAPWLQWISLSKNNFGNQKNRGKIGTATCFHFFKAFIHGIFPQRER